MRPVYWSIDWKMPTKILESLTPPYSFEDSVDSSTLLLQVERHDGARKTPLELGHNVASEDESNH